MNPISHPSSPPSQPRNSSRFRSWIGAVSILLVPQLASGQNYTVNFEGAGETKTGYGSGAVTLNGISWNMTDALIGTEAADFKNGARSARMRGYGTSSMTMLADKSGGAGVITFSYRRYGTDAQVAWAVEYSSDGGVNWLQAGVNFTAPATNDVQTFSNTLNIPGTVRFRIISKGTGTSNRRLNIDDIVISDYSGSDFVDPAITSQSPAPGAVDVATNTAISITFNELIAAGTGGVQLHEEAGETDILVPIGAVGIAGNTATFSPSMPLGNSKTYYVTIDNDAFMDRASPANGFDGISSPTAWSFTTVAPDVTRPVATLTPADNGTAVLPAADLLINYNEPVQLGAGTITIRKSVGSVLVEEIPVAGSRVTLVGNTLRINPTLLLDPNTAYEVEVPEGVVSDLAGNDSFAIAAGGEWSFTTKALPSVVISQYYEGLTAGDRYIELKNLTNAPLTLSNYRLTVWSDTSPSDNEGWKSGTNSTTRSIALDGVTIPALGHLLIANSAATIPAYAANSADIKGTSTDGATLFDGDDSIVLYSGATNVQANVVDAISIVSLEASNTSLYRITDTPSFTFDTGYSTMVDLGQAWGQATNTEVDAALSSDAKYLKSSVILTAPVLETFALGAGATTAATEKVTLDYTRTGGVPTEYMVSFNADFADATWTTMPGTSPVFNLSSGNGAKVAYFKIRNSAGESSVLSDTIERVALQPSTSLMITQYYEGTSNNKYVELANASASPIDINGWQLVRWGNAETENWKTTGIATGSSSGVIPLSGTLAPGEAIILSNNSAVSPVLAANAFINTSLVNHTGNDSYVLYQGAVQSANIRDAISFTTANEGPDTSFVRLGSGAGFDVTLGSAITAYPAIWAQNTLAIVNAATAGQNIHLGTYLDAVALDFDAWIAGFFTGSDPLIIGFTADPDGDGISNGVEALIGGDPSVAGVFGTTELVKTGNTFSFLYPQNRDLPTGLSAGYEWSTDMVTWNVSGATQGGVTVTLADDVWTDTGSGPITYQVVATVTLGTPAKLFVRVLSVNQ
jgi:hypothetical protein